MRIEFIRSARESFPWTQAQMRIGSAPGNDLVLAGDQVAAQHVLVQADDRGWLLRVLPGAGRIYVNARPVRELAFLRAGDMVSVGDCRLLFCADGASDRLQPPPVPDPANCTVALRVVAGPLSGKVLPVHGYLELGSRSRFALELPRGEMTCLRVAWCDGRLIMSVPESSGRHAVRVNGNEVREATLQTGDQIGVAMHRFVVEAPGIELARERALPPSEPSPTPTETESHAGAGWLILTATILALGIALLLLVRL